VSADFGPAIAMLEAVATKMRALGVEKYQFEVPVAVDATSDDAVLSTLERKLYATIELGPAPTPEGAEDEEHIQRLRDHNEIMAMEREQRRKFAASSIIGPPSRLTYERDRRRR
jgi:hypothetical protein